MYFEDIFKVYFGHICNILGDATLYAHVPQQGELKIYKHMRLHENRTST